MAATAPFTHLVSERVHNYTLKRKCPFGAKGDAAILCVQEVAPAQGTATQATAPQVWAYTTHTNNRASSLIRVALVFTPAKLQSFSLFTSIWDQNIACHLWFIVNKKLFKAWPKIKVPEPLEEGNKTEPFTESFYSNNYQLHLHFSFRSNYEIKRNMVKSVTRQSKFSCKWKAWNSYRKRTYALPRDTSYSVLIELTGKEYNLHNVRLVA